MTTKKAIIIGTLCAIGVTLTAYAIKKSIEIKPKTMTAVNADNFEYTPKNQIITEYTSNGYNYDIEPNYTDGQSDPSYQNTPQTFTHTYTQPKYYEENFVYTLNTTLPVTTPAGENLIDKLQDLTNLYDTYTEDYPINFEIYDSNNNSYTCTKIRWFVEQLQEENPYDNNMGISVYITENDYNDWEGLMWFPDDYQFQNKIKFTENNEDSDNADAIIWIYNNSSVRPADITRTENFLANRKTEKETNTANSITYTIENQKTFHNGRTKSEGLVQLKIYSQGTTESLYLTDAYFRSAIPRFSELGEMWAKFKIAKIDTFQSMTGSNYNEYNSYENFYNSLTGKTNIYSTNWYWNKTTQGGQASNNGTYSNETGTRIVHMSDGTFSEISGYSWQITEQEINIKQHQKINYLVIYYSFEVTGTPSYQDYATAMNTRVGTAGGIKGYSIATTIVTPPDIEDGNFMSLTGMILNILTLPFTFLSQAFNLTLWADTPWAFNIKNAIFVMIGIMTFLFIIKLFTRGFDSLGNFSDGWQRHKLTKEQRKLTKANRQKAEKKVNKDK